MFLAPRKAATKSFLGPSYGLLGHLIRAERRADVHAQVVDPDLGAVGEVGELVPKGDHHVPVHGTILRGGPGAEGGGRGFRGSARE